MSALLLIFVAVFLYLEKRSRRQARFHHTSSRYSSLLQKQLNKTKNVIALIVCVTPVLLGFIVPVCFLFDLALDTYSEVLNKDFYSLLFNSLLLAFVTAILALLIALFMAYSNRNINSVVNRFMVRFVSMVMPFPVPLLPWVC